MWTKNIFKKKLLAQRSEIASQLAESLKQDHGTSIDALSEVEELAKTQNDLTTINLMERRMQKHIEHIDLALKKLDSGKFGQCIDCEDLIAEKRLELNLECERCLKCQEIHEKAFGFKKVS